LHGQASTKVNITLFAVGCSLLAAGLSATVLAILQGHQLLAPMTAGGLAMIAGILLLLTPTRSAT